MNEYNGGMRRGLPAIGKSWQGFWFGPQPMYTLGLVRMAFGALAVLWTLWLWPLLDEMFGTNGVAPQRPSIPYTWSIFDIWSSNPAVLIGWALLLAASIALMVGWHSRFAAIVVFILILSFQRRDPWFFNAGDAVVRIEALFIALAPTRGGVVAGSAPPHRIVLVGADPTGLADSAAPGSDVDHLCGVCANQALRPDLA